MLVNLRCSACDDALGVVDAERGLRDIGDRRVGRQVELVDVGFVLHQDHRARDLPHGALDLGMAGVPDQDQLAALPDIALALVVDLGHQRTGRVEHRQAALRGLVLDALGDAMGAEDRDGVVGNFRHVLHEHGALGLEAFDDVLVVHDLVPHIDRRAVFLQRALDDLDGAHDASAKSPRLSQDHFHSVSNLLSFQTDLGRIGPTRRNLRQT